MKKILITGANGLLGQKLVKLLVAKSDLELIATGRGDNRNPRETRDQYVYEPMDITSAPEVEHVIDRYSPDAVIHTAAMTNVDQCETDHEGCRKLNVEATDNIVKACKKNASFLLHLSTDFIFDGQEGPYDEEAKANPISFYGKSKLKSEEIVIGSNIKWAIARTVLVYGITPKMSRSNIILWVKKSLEEGKPIQVVNDQWRTPTLAEDLAMGCYLIVEKQAEGVFNISGEDFLNPYQMAVKTAEFFKLDQSSMTETDGSKFSQPAKRPPKTGFDITKAKSILGFRPHSFDEGIAVLATQLKEL